ncbi:hypothetical protein VB773_08680 [Haloarculaceae archaeon H-GB2-1]|nr:hypothetical protein [Haloarculaceae archaeon H-GB11]MEA5407634.1 hypothetical protein [Haloarculaceae archaeon H-GB2-1]
MWVPTPSDVVERRCSPDQRPLRAVDLLAVTEVRQLVDAHRRDEPDASDDEREREDERQRVGDAALVARPNRGLSHTQ